MTALLLLLLLHLVLSLHRSRAHLLSQRLMN
jgi:hypothetical protein